jgi:hypothetical protein
MANFLLYIFFIHFFITPEDTVQENKRIVERVETVKRTAETAEKNEEKEPAFASHQMGLGQNHSCVRSALTHALSGK